VVTFDARLDAIRSGPTGPDIGAFFDFDGTLIDGYSASALYAHRIRNRDLGAGELLHTVRAMSGGDLAESEFADPSTADSPAGEAVASRSWRASVSSCSASASAATCSTRRGDWSRPTSGRATPSR
jgi:hypothetical protein